MRGRMMVSAGIVRTLRSVRRLHRMVIRRAASSSERSITQSPKNTAEANSSLDHVVESVGTTSSDPSIQQLGDFDGRIVSGKIVHRVCDDLYIDIGLKFNAVCKAPSVNSEKYVIGANVLVRLHDPELSERFLGARRDLTLLEADAALIRLYGARSLSRKAAHKGERLERRHGDGSTRGGMDEGHEPDSP
uniref:28S ribosomal protein S28, mitochondrial n=2 Tax=Parascaris univalens TaxID=6257 RepID=A0A914ZFD8_PARUN